MAESSESSDWTQLSADGVLPESNFLAESIQEGSQKATSAQWGKTYPTYHYHAVNRWKTYRHPNHQAPLHWSDRPTQKGEPGGVRKFFSWLFSGEWIYIVYFGMLDISGRFGSG